MVRKTILIDDELAKDLDLFARKDARDFSGALRFAARIGLLALENPELTISEIRDILEAKAEYEEGRTDDLDIRNL